ncbi:hypothetical protein [Fimbriiglobus ruber]|nr:hypothetical protein [Fimbriiglobus ruber]
MANAILSAAEKGLQNAGSDPVVIETIWLLMRLPVAARTDDFTAALLRSGLHVTDDPSLMELVAAVSGAIDTKAQRAGRSELGEMAQMAAVETLTEVIGSRLNTLFGPSPEQVQAEVAKLRTNIQFGLFAKDFFARFVFKTLTFFLSRTLPDHVGEGRRFSTLAEQAAFTAALDAHCREAAKVVEAYSGDWLMKHNYEADGRISREEVAGFTSYAMTKLVAELRLGVPSDAA